MNWSLPRFSPLALAVFRRNLLVWRKLLGPAVVMNFGEPLLYLFGLGYGLGLFIGEMQAMPYLTFLASGIIASSTMNAAAFEATYSVFTRMVPQRTHEAMLASPLEVDDIMAGEMLWCAFKGTLSTAAIFIVALLVGGVQGDWAPLVVPLGLLVGLAFSGVAMCMAAVSPSYDFFSYYFTLGITPMFVLSGVFYPVDSLPSVLQWLMQLLPLVHAVELIRPLVAGLPVEGAWLHLAVLLLYALGGYYLAVVLARRRLLV